MTDLATETLPADADERRTIVAPFELLRSDDGDGLTLTGYAAVFNSPTRIDTWEGNFIEVIAPGAFRHTIRNSRPIMQYDHGQHPLIGSLPVASISKLREDARGLFVEARVFDNWLTEPLRDAIRDQAISGMSFRFSVVKESWSHDDDGTDTRTLREVKLYELGPVAWPAYSDTSVALRSLERATGLTIIDSPTAPAESSANGPVGIDPASGQSAHLNQLRARALRLRSDLLKEKA